MRAGGRSSRPTRAECGFSLVEALISSLLVVIVMVVALTAFDASSRLTQSQLDIADLQQNVRIAQRDIARHVRMAGRGGLPRIVSTRVDQNAPADTTIGAARVVAGTDVLKLRGIFDSPLFRVDAAEDATYDVAGDVATLIIDSVTRSGYEQPLDALKRLKDDSDVVSPEPIVLVSRQSDAIWAVVELADIEFSTITVPVPGSAVDAERATLTLHIGADEGTHTADYLTLSSSGAYPAALTSVAFAGVLEEHWFFVRELRTVPGDPNSALAPKLVRARMVPGADTVHAEAGSLSHEVADRILDFQVAFGNDLDANGVIDELDEDGEPLATIDDEWHWNDEEDDDTLGWDAAPLLLVRATILGRTARADNRYVDAAIATLANRTYGESPTPANEAERRERRFRRRILESDIRLRN